MTENAKEELADQVSDKLTRLIQSANDLPQSHPIRIKVREMFDLIAEQTNTKHDDEPNQKFVKKLEKIQQELIKLTQERS